MGSEPSDGERMYRRLEVPPEASAQQIRHAYRRLAHDVHPDANPEDPEASHRFQEITEAYEILSSPDRRARYDQARRQIGIPVYSNPASNPRAGCHVGTGPTVIGRPPFPAAPLIAGPVHVDTSGHAPQARLPDAGGELSRLIEAILSVWGSY